MPISQKNNGCRQTSGKRTRGSLNTKEKGPALEVAAVGGEAAGSEALGLGQDQMTKQRESAAKRSAPFLYLLEQLPQAKQ